MKARKCCFALALGLFEREQHQMHGCLAIGEVAALLARFFQPVRKHEHVDAKWWEGPGARRKRPGLSRSWGVKSIFRTSVRTKQEGVAAKQVGKLALEFISPFNQ